MAGGCRLDRDIPRLLGSAFTSGALDERYLPGPKVEAYVYSGIAAALP